MIVNLSLERSSKIKISARPGRSITHYNSPPDGSALALDADNSLWLTAGQGALVAMPWRCAASPSNLSTTGDK
jgi:hypothetical protein